MTVIVGMVDAATGSVLVGADRQASDSANCLQMRDDPKVFEHDGVVVGFTWSYRYGQIVRYHAAPEWVPADQIEDVHEWMVCALVPVVRGALAANGYLKVSEGLEASGEMIVGARGRLFVVGSDFAVAEPSSLCATSGSGGRVAIGALTALRMAGLPPRDCIDRAIRIASVHDTTCSGKPLILASAPSRVEQTAEAAS